MQVASKGTDINKFVNVKRYGSSYKLTLLKNIPNEIKPHRDVWKELEKGYSSSKMDCNISRARSRIFELAMCNEWQYFATCTLDKTKYDRSDLAKFQKDIALFIQHQRRKWKAPNIKYILIPELHEDLINWHMHGLIGGIKAEMLSDFIQGVHPQYLVEHDYKNWQDYSDKFGFVSLGIIKNQEQVSKYITKYITKDASKGVQEVGGHIYYRSQGLQGHELIKKGTLAHAPSQWEFENDYVKILWIQADEVNHYVKGGMLYDDSSMREQHAITG